jgi:hypothetical protein
VTENEAKQIQAQQYQQLAAQQQAATQQQDIAEASQAADLMQKVDQMGGTTSGPPAASTAPGNPGGEINA